MQQLAVGGSPIISTLEDSLVSFCRAPQQFLLDRARTHGPVALYRVGTEIFASVSDPDLVHAVLHGDMADYEKGPLYDLVRFLFGDGVFTAEREHWTSQHDVIAPMFARHRNRRLNATIADLTAQQIDRWRRLGDHDDDDVMAAMKRLAFDVVAIGLFSLYDSRQREALFAEMYRLDRMPLVSVNYFHHRVPLGQLDAIIDRSEQSTEAVRRRLDEMLYTIADHRLAGHDAADDVIGALMASAFMRELPIERRRIVLRHNIASLLTAGYVSTGESMFWVLYHLARHPGAQSRARADVAAAPAPLVDSPPYLAAVLNESMRLFPPAWYIGRTTRRAMSLGGVEIPAGTQVVCSPFVLHRSPALWADAEQFSPERFLPGATIAPHSFIPFGSGPRACMGRALSMMEMTSLVSATLTAFDLDLPSDVAVVLTGSYSMQTREPVRVRMRPRP